MSAASIPFHGQFFGMPIQPESMNSHMQFSPFFTFFVPNPNQMNSLHEAMQRSQEEAFAIKPTDKSFVESLPDQLLEMDSECSICLSDIAAGSRAHILPCGHTFCIPSKDCDGIKPWLKENHTCPVCRKELPQGPTRPRNVPTPSPIPSPFNFLQPTIHHHHHHHHHHAPSANTSPASGQSSNSSHNHGRGRVTATHADGVQSSTIHGCPSEGVSVRLINLTSPSHCHLNSRIVRAIGWDANSRRHMVDIGNGRILAVRSTNIQLLPNTNVFLADLRREPSLNGQRAHVVRWVASSQRYEIQVVGTNRVIRVRPDNLALEHAARDTARRVRSRNS